MNHLPRVALILGFLLVRLIPAAEPNGGAFTVIALPDTQYYSETYHQTFTAQTSWIIRNTRSENIIYVTHLGDVVQNADKNAVEWEVAQRAMSALDGVVPWGIAIGNHDYDRVSDPNGIAQTFLKYFTSSPFRSSPDGLNSYQLIAAGRMQLLMLHLEADVPDSAISWAEGVLQRYPDRIAIVSTHIYLDDRSHARTTKPYFRHGGNSGEMIWQKLVRRRTRILMVLCGHWGEARGQWHQTSLNDAGQPVFEMGAALLDSAILWT